MSIQANFNEETTNAIFSYNLLNYLYMKENM